MKKIIVAIDSFKGCLTSVEANQAAAQGVLARMPEAQVVQVPVSDGGEGFMAAFQAAMGGEIVEVNASTSSVDSSSGKAISVVAYTAS